MFYYFLLRSAPQTPNCSQLFLSDQRYPGGNRCAECNGNAPITSNTALAASGCSNNEQMTLVDFG